MADNDPPLVWSSIAGSKYAVVLVLQGVKDADEITAGVSRAKGFPADAHFKMDQKFKKQVALADNISNAHRFPLISKSLREFIERHQPQNVEFLKVTIFDHKDKPVKDEYYIMNPLTIVDCIDKKASRLMWNAIDPEMIAGVYELALNEKAIPKDLAFFRPKHLERRIFVRHDVAEAIADEGFTGVLLDELAEFTM